MQTYRSTKLNFVVVYSRPRVSLFTKFHSLCRVLGIKKLPTIVESFFCCKAYATLTFATTVSRAIGASRKNIFECRICHLTAILYFFGKCSFRIGADSLAQDNLQNFGAYSLETKVISDVTMLRNSPFVGENCGSNT